MKPKHNVSLKAFIVGSSNPDDRMPGCATYDHDRHECLLETVEDKCPCLVLQEGKRCPYFERAVLPTSADIGQQDHLYSLYAEATGAVIDRFKDTNGYRGCPDCGAPLKPRHRYCPDCARKRERAAGRERRRKHYGRTVQCNALTGQPSLLRTREGTLRGLQQSPCEGPTQTSDSSKSGS